MTTNDDDYIYEQLEKTFDLIASSMGKSVSGQGRKDVMRLIRLRNIEDGDEEAEFLLSIDIYNFLMLDISNACEEEEGEIL